MGGGFRVSIRRRWRSLYSSLEDKNKRLREEVEKDGRWKRDMRERGREGLLLKRVQSVGGVR